MASPVNGNASSKNTGPAAQILDDIAAFQNQKPDLAKSIAALKTKGLSAQDGELLARIDYFKAKGQDITGGAQTLDDILKNKNQIWQNQAKLLGGNYLPDDIKAAMQHEPAKTDQNQANEAGQPVQGQSTEKSPGSTQAAEPGAQQSPSKLTPDQEKALQAQIGKVLSQPDSQISEADINKLPDSQTKHLLEAALKIAKEAGKSSITKQDVQSVLDKNKSAPPTEGQTPPAQPPTPQTTPSP